MREQRLHYTIYNKKGHNKRGKWSAPKPVISANHDSRLVTVQSRKGRQINVAFENTRAFVKQDGFTQLVQDSMDAMNDIIQD